MADEVERLGEKARRVLDDPSVNAVVSAVSVWEIAIKRSLGKLTAPDDVVSQLVNSPVELLPITPRHADAVAELADHHRDPFDRLLIAQSKIERIPIVTADMNFANYGVEVIW